MNDRLRYTPNPRSRPITKYIGGVGKFDIYISSDGSNYVVRFGDHDSGKFPVKEGCPSQGAVKTEISRLTYLSDDEALRISKMIELFG